MKSISAGLKSHFTGEVTTIALCWKITRKDSTVLGFTSLDEDITFDSVTYQADTGSFSGSSIRSGSDLSVDNLDVQAIFDSSAITEADVLAGKYDYAVVELFAVNYKDLTQGKVSLMGGVLGEVTAIGGVFKAELRSYSQKLQQVIGRTYQKRCDANLGDSRCGVTIASYTVTGNVTGVTNRRQFTGSSLPTTAGGKITWTSGANNGLSMEVKSASGSTIALFEEMPYDIAISDTYSVHSGCDKNFSTCVNTFSNGVNFRGFPHIPGPDRALRYPDAK